MPAAPAPAPARRVLAAFGTAGPARRLPGGRGTSWTAGDVVLKPGALPRLQTWLAEVVSQVDQVGFRLPAAVPTSDGDWTCDGWSATALVDGVPADGMTPPDWHAVLAAGRAFHRAVAGLPRQGLPDTSESWWSIADQVAWGERQMDLDPGLRDCARRLRAGLAPLGPSQPVHGDLTGNILVAPGLDPVVLDVSPYWRPPAYAEGVVIADALCWYDGSARLLRDHGVAVAAVARALLFRLVTSSRVAASRGERVAAAEVARYERATTLVAL